MTVDDARVLLRNLPAEANPRVARGAMEKSKEKLASLNDTINVGVGTVQTWCLGPDSVVMALSGGAPRKHIRRTISAQLKWLSIFGLDVNKDNIGWLQDNRGCMLALLLGQPSKIVKMKFSHDGRVLGTLGKTGEVVLWDTGGAKRLDYRANSFREVTHPKMLRILAVLYPMPLTSENMQDFHFSPDGMFLVTVHGTRNVTLWDLVKCVDALTPETTLKGHAKALQKQVIDSRKKEKKEFKSLMGHPLPTSLLFFRYNRSTISRGATIIYGHDKRVSHVAWSPDSRVFATASEDSSMRIIRAHDCHLCAILSDSLSEASIMKCQFTFDCASILALSQDAVLRCYNVRTALEPILGPVTMLESIEAVDSGKIAWSGVSADDLALEGDMPPIQPDCSYEMHASPTCFSMMLTIDGIHRVAVGTESGMIILVDLMNAARLPEPVITCSYPYRLGEERIEASKVSFRFFNM